MIVPICQVGVVVVTHARRQFLEKCVWPDRGRGLSGIDVDILKMIKSNSGSSGATGPRLRRVRIIRVPERAF